MTNSSKLKKLILAASFLVMFLSLASTLKAEIKVVTTIQPLHSLIANVMDGTGDLKLILAVSYTHLTLPTIYSV